MDVIWKNITSFRGDCRFWQSIISDFLIWLHRNINLLESATPPIPEFVFKKMLESTSESFPICICFDPSIYCFMLVWRENAQLLLVFVWASLPFSFNIQKQQEDLNSWKFSLKKKKKIKKPHIKKIEKALSDSILPSSFHTKAKTGQPCVMVTTWPLTKSLLWWVTL